MISSKGIEADPAKLKSILEIPPPRTEKEVQGFLEKLQYISRFINQSTSIYEPIFKLLRKDSTKVWNEACQKAFDRIKQYLTQPPVLMPP